MKLQKANRPLTGELTVPGDKSISHRAVMLGALAEGDTEITHFLNGADCLSTIDCFRRLGISIEKDSRRILVHGRGLHGLSAPSSVLGCGNSGEGTPEGFHWKNVFASELTGPILVKNPRLLETVAGAILARRGEALPAERPVDPYAETGYAVAAEQLRLRISQK